MGGFARCAGHASQRLALRAGVSSRRFARWVFQAVGAILRGSAEPRAALRAAVPV